MRITRFGKCPEGGRHSCRPQAYALGEGRRDGKRKIIASLPEMGTAWKCVKCGRIFEKRKSRMKRLGRTL